jgi:hypothetical protein
MGSDLYMESSNFRPRQTLAFVNSRGRIEIYRDYFYYGYKKERTTMEDTPNNRKIVKSLIYAKFVDERPV